MGSQKSNYFFNNHNLTISILGEFVSLGEFVLSNLHTQITTKGKDFTFV